MCVGGNNDRLTGGEKRKQGNKKGSFSKGKEEMVGEKKMRQKFPVGPRQ